MTWSKRLSFKAFNFRKKTRTDTRQTCGPSHYSPLGPSLLTAPPAGLILGPQATAPTPSLRPSSPGLSFMDSACNLGSPLLSVTCSEGEETGARYETQTPVCP